MRSAAARLVIACLIHLARAGDLYDRETLLRDFEQDLLAQPPGSSTMLVMDVGANDGKWTSGWAAPLARRVRSMGTRAELVMVEPQPELRGQLSSLAQSLGATFVPAAVGKANGAAC